MNKRYLHHAYTKLRTVKPGYLLIATLLFAAISVAALRQNNFKMIELRQAVITADEQNEDVETALQKLREHVHGHMNTNLASGEFAIKPPIQLKARYERLVAQEQANIKKASEAVTKQGEAICATRFPAGGYNAPRVACVQEYVAANAGKSDPVPDELYKFDFISPRWSPDLAGWSLVITALLALLLVLRIISGRIAKHYLH
jgi:hypothetical protein